MGVLEILSEMELGKVATTLRAAFLQLTIYFVFSVAWIYACFITFNFQQDVSAVVFVSTVLQLVLYVVMQVFGDLGITETCILYFWSPFDNPKPN